MSESKSSPLVGLGFIIGMTAVCLSALLEFGYIIAIILIVIGTMGATLYVHVHGDEKVPLSSWARDTAYTFLYCTAMYGIHMIVWPSETFIASPEMEGILLCMISMLAVQWIRNVEKEIQIEELKKELENNS